jgi:hypothetical protein
MTSTVTAQQPCCLTDLHDLRNIIELPIISVRLWTIKMVMYLLWTTWNHLDVLPLVAWTNGENHFFQSHQLCKACAKPLGCHIDVIGDEWTINFKSEMLPMLQLCSSTLILRYPTALDFYLCPLFLRELCFFTHVPLLRCCPSFSRAETGCMLLSRNTLRQQYTCYGICMTHKLICLSSHWNSTTHAVSCLPFAARQKQSSLWFASHELWFVSRGSWMMIQFTFN